MDFIDLAIDAYADQSTTPMHPLLNQLVKQTYATQKCPQMVTGHIEGRLLKMLVQISRASFVLEIGMFTGFSALSMAEGLPDNGRLITCEINPELLSFVQPYFDQSPHGKKIDVRLGPALETIAQIHEPLDLVFMDADKENNPNYFEAVLPKVRPGGLMVIDNTLWSGAVLDPQDHETRIIAGLNKQLPRDERVEVVMLPIRDGVTLVRKKENT